MKTLLERLKPEYLELLESETSKYPNTYLMIKNELKTKIFFTDLTVGTAEIMCLDFNVPFELYFINDLFGKYE
jgi:hypothetical protein